MGAREFWIVGSIGWDPPFAYFSPFQCAALSSINSSSDLKKCQFPWVHPTLGFMPSPSFVPPVGVSGITYLHFCFDPSVACYIFLSAALLPSVWLSLRSVGCSKSALSLQCSRQRSGLHSTPSSHSERENRKLTAGPGGPHCSESRLQRTRSPLCQ